MAPEIALVHESIATVNGKEWFERYNKIHALFPPAFLRTTLAEWTTDITGEDVYAKPENDDTQTRYDVVLNWQTNYLHTLCDINGGLVKVDPVILTDDTLMCSFYAGREGKSLDVGCNTGKNMMSAVKHSEGKVDAYGIEYSKDSTNLAVAAFDSDHAFLGDAAGDYVDEHSWDGQFTMAHCTFVMQHMPPQAVDAALKNISRSLSKGGEYLTTFKDAPTAEQLTMFGMGAWSDEIFTANVADQQDDYIKKGFLHTTIWDDDYYPGVTSHDPPAERDLQAPGPHRRELYFYGLEWMKEHAKEYGLIAREVGVVCDAKIPFSVFSWKVIFVKQ